MSLSSRPLLPLCAVLFILLVMSTLVHMYVIWTSTTASMTINKPLLHDVQRNNHDVAALRESDFIQRTIDKYVETFSHLNYTSIPNQIPPFQTITMNSILNAFSKYNVLFYGDSIVDNVWSRLHMLLYYHQSVYFNHNESFFKQQMRSIPELKTLFQFHYANQFEDFENMWCQHNLNRRNYFNISMANNRPIHNRKIGFSHSNYSFNNTHIHMFRRKIQYCGAYPSFEWIDQLQKMAREAVNVIVMDYDILFCTHLFHLNATRRNSAYSGKPQTMKANNMNLENTLYNSVNDYLKLDALKCVIVYGGNSICQSFYFKEWKTVLDVWDQNTFKSLNERNIDNTTLNECMDAVGLSNHQIVVNTSYGFVMNGKEFCANQLYTNNGVYYLNQRLKMFIKHAQQTLIGPEHKLKYLYFDMFTLTDNHCRSTFDGRHYTGLLSVKINMITNIINKYC
eukprot:125663_1